MIIPSKHNGYTRDGVRRVYIDGGGGGGTPEKQTTVVDIPDWAKPYAKESLGKAQALSESPYQAYGGERIAQFSPLQKQAFGRAEGQQVAGQVGLGTGLATMSGISSFQDPGTAQGFMSPYMDAVVQRQMESAQRQADIASTQRGAAAVRAGAFGGSRQAIENAEAARALASQKGQIQEQGLQSAFERAQSQFNAEQANRLASAQALGQLGQQQFGQQMDITGQQATFGGQQRQATQDILSQQYQDFLNQQRAPYDQLAFMSSMIRGTPLGQTTTMYQPGPSTASQLVGLGTAAAGAYGAAKGAAAGGEVKGYAAGGGIGALLDNVGSLSDQQLGQMQEGEKPPLTAAIVAEEILRRQALREDAVEQQAMLAPTPQTTVAEEALAGLPGLPAGNLDNMDTATMAGGGIVAFDQGGSIYGGLRFEDLQPYRAGAYFRSGDKRIDPVTNKPLTFADFLQLQQREKAAAAAPAAQAIIQREVQSNPKAAANFVATQKPEAVAAAGIPREKAEQAAAAKAQPTAEKPAPTGTGAAPAGLSALQAQTTSGIGDLKKQVEDINTARTAAAQAAMERTKKSQEEDGVFGAEREKRLKAQEEGLKGAEGKNFNMALIEAGLAMMAGDSANAFENIGKGALVGTAAYTKGMDKISAKREKLDEALANLDELRYGEKKANRKELNEAQARVDNAAVENANALYAYGKDALGMTREDAKFAVQTRLQQQQIAASNRPSSEMQMIERIMAEKKIPFSEAMAVVAGAKRTPVDTEKLRGEWLDPMKRQQINADYPNVKTFDDYVTVMGSGGGGASGGYKVVSVR